VDGRGSSLPRIAAASTLRAVRRFLRPTATVRLVETYSVLRRLGLSREGVDSSHGCHTLYDMKRSSAVISVSVPPESAREFERLAQREGRNKSELFETLAVYVTYQETQTFESLQRYGASTARRAGIHDESDVERLIQDSRGQ
jgi:Ribbon-helix-helix protein, copG family